MFGALARRPVWRRVVVERLFSILWQPPAPSLGVVFERVMWLEADRVGNSKIGSVAKIGAAKTEYRPKPRPERPSSGTQPMNRTSGRP